MAIDTSREEEYISELLGIDGREQCVEEVAEKEGHDEEEGEDKEEGAGGRKRKRMGGRGGGSADGGDKMMMCSLLVLDSVTSTPQWIRQPRPRVYLKEGTYHTRLFRGNSTNDMKK